MKKIIVTAIGSFSAKCVITNLKENGYFVLGTDIYPGDWHYETKICDDFYQVPLATMTKEYIDTLLKISGSKGIDSILPLTDLEIDVLNEHRNSFEKMGIKLLMPSKEVLDVSRDKFKLYSLFKDDTFVPSIPTTTKLEEIRTEDYPILAKPRSGRSSEGIIKMETAEFLPLLKGRKDYIFQKILDGVIVTVDYVRSSKTGNDFMISRQELLRTKNGAGLTVKLFNDVNLNKIVSHIGNKLHINGCINMEFILYDNNYFLIDINPRFSAGVAFSCKAGYDMVTSNMKCYNEEDILAPLSYPEQIMTKTYIEEVTKIFDH